MERYSKAEIIRVLEGLRLSIEIGAIVPAYFPEGEDRKRWAEANAVVMRKIIGDLREMLEIPDLPEILDPNAVFE